MDTDLVLLLLRIVSAMLLLLILATIYVVMWREYRSLTGPMGDAQHNYGQLMVVEESNGSHITIGESYPLLSRTTLGRAPINSIVLDDTFVSNEHAQIILREGQWWLEDCQSRNGTTLNGVKIDQPVIIARGDIIGVGQKLFRWDVE